MLKVAILRSNPVNPDSRVERIVTLLQNIDIEPRVVAWDRNKSISHEDHVLGSKIYRFGLKSQFGSGLSNILNLFRWNTFLLAWLYNNRRNYDVIHACDFDTIIPALIAKYMLNKKVVYDIFDFYADSVIGIPDFFKKIIKSIDLKLIGLVDSVIIADDCRLDQIKGSKPKKISVMYNSPTNSIATVPVYNMKLRIVFIGILQKERGLCEMIEVVSLNPQFELVIGGFGADETNIKDRMKPFKNMQFIGKISYADALIAMSKSDVLFATYNPAIPNHRYSSANKLFESMMLGKHIIVAENTHMDIVVEKHQLGKIVRYGDKSDLLEALKSISSISTEEKRNHTNKCIRLFQELYSPLAMQNVLRHVYETL